MFSNCKYLKEVVIPNSVKSINEKVFEGCGLTKIIIPNNVTTIKDQAFYGCEKLIYVFIGINVKRIHVGAFANCREIKHAYCYSENPPSTTHDSSFSNIFQDSMIEYATLHVPTTSVDAYKNIEPWKSFMEIVAIKDSEQDPTGIKAVEIPENDKGIIYDLNGRRVEHPSKDLYIKKGKKYVVK